MRLTTKACSERRKAKINSGIFDNELSPKGGETLRGKKKNDSYKHSKQHMTGSLYVLKVMATLYTGIIVDWNESGVYNVYSSVI